MASPLDGGNVLLTGASSGIGREMARRIAPRARKLVLVARRLDRLDALRAELLATGAQLEIVTRPTDLSDRHAVMALGQEARDTHGVDVLVNNAGLGDHARFEAEGLARIEEMLLVNVVALTLLSRLLVPRMVAQKRGGILNVSSGFGLVSMPGFAVYCGTKHYVTAFTDALAGEVADAGVHVTQVCPGPVRTEFAEVAGLDEGLAPPGFVWLDAGDCAQQALAAFDRNKPLVIPGLTMKAALTVGQRVPRWVYRNVGGRLTARRKG